MRKTSKKKPVKDSKPKWVYLAHKAAKQAALELTSKPHQLHLKKPILLTNGELIKNPKWSLLYDIPIPLQQRKGDGQVVIPISVTKKTIGGPSPPPDVRFRIFSVGTHMIGGELKSPIVISENPKRVRDLIIEISRSESEEVAGNQCNPNYDYSDLLNRARSRIHDFVKNFECPSDCPFKEFFPNPNTYETIELSCIIYPGNRISYGAFVTAYFACVVVQA